MVEETPQIILTVGISGSGKSTFAESLSSNFVDINRDKCRLKLFGPNYRLNGSKERLVTKECEKLWTEAKSQKKNVVISDCNLKKTYLEYWKQKAEESGYEFHIKYFPISLEEAFERDVKRGEKAVGRNVLIRQYSLWLDIINARRYVPSSEIIRKAIICDIDGTVAIAKNRSFYDYSKVITDIPRIQIISMIKSWANAENMEIIFVSGRDDWCRKDTEEWLKKHFLLDKIELLYMRHTGDNRKDKIIKEEIFWEHIADNFNVVAVVDDRPQVVRMWHDIGLENVINVQQGYNDF